MKWLWQLFFGPRGKDFWCRAFDHDYEDFWMPFAGEMAELFPDGATRMAKCKDCGKLFYYVDTPKSYG